MPIFIAFPFTDFHSRLSSGRNSINITQNTLLVQHNVMLRIYFMSRHGELCEGNSWPSSFTIIFYLPITHHLIIVLIDHCSKRFQEGPVPPSPSPLQANLQSHMHYVLLGFIISIYDILRYFSYSFRFKAELRQWCHGVWRGRDAALG